MSVSKQRTKVVVRRLPPGLTEDAFKATIDKLLPEGTYNWFSYFQGKVSLRKTVLSRAYLNFVNPAAVYDFKAKFDGHAFITTKGSQFRCTVEYAPFQKVPNPPRKRNPLEGTIDQDPHYQAFLKTLESGPELLPSAAVQREQQEKAVAAAGGPSPDSGAVKVTPLMEYLRNKYLSNPGLRLGGVRRNKGKASATPSVNAKATKVSGRAAAAAAVAVAGAKTTSSKQGKDAGAAELTQGQAKIAALPAGVGPGKGSKQQQQQQGKGAAAAFAAPSQQQKQQQQQQQQRPGSVSQAPKIMAHPQQQQQQQQQQGAGAQQIRPSSSAQHVHQQDGKGPTEHVKGTAAVPTAAATAAAGPIKIMPRPASAAQASNASTPAPPPHAGAPTGRPASTAAPASSAKTTGTPSTSTPSAPKVPIPVSSSAAVPAAPAAPTVGSETAAESAPGTQAGGTAPPPSGRPERVRRVRAGFAAYQPKRRGVDEDG